MTAKPSTPSAPRTSGPLPVVLLLLGVAAGIYAGMRWHATFERWLLPSASSASVAAPPDQSTSPDAKKQLWTCGMHPQVIQDHPGDCPICHMKLTPLVTSDQGGPASSAGAPDGAVVIDPAIVQNMGIRTVQVTQGPLAQTVRVSAMITEAESAHRDINLRVSGWIQTLYASTDGMEVKKGDPLFDLYSPELRLAIEELISARRAAKSSADAEPGMRETSASLAAAAESRLNALGLTPEQVAQLGDLEHAPSVVTFLSPMNAHVTEKEGVYTGSAVTAGQRIFRLAERTMMWVEARVPENQLGRVRLGQKASARADAYPGRTFDGEVTFIHPHFDEMTRTALVRMVITNHQSALHQGMYASVEIAVGDGQPVVLVPREAIIDTGDSQLVFVSTGKGHFEPRPVVLGRPGDHALVEILSGLSPGETVVASGQFLVDSESRLREAVAKFLTQKTAASTPPPASTPSQPTPQPKAPPPVAIGSTRVDAMVSAYLALAESLGKTQTESAPLKPDALVDALRALHQETTNSAIETLITSASAAAEALKSQPLDRQRELFKQLSAKVIALVQKLPPSPAVAGTLYIVNCPMAKGDWLQRSTDIANPYYAEDMKECGNVVRPLVDPKGAR